MNEDKEFLIGCNYWASDKSVYMWKNFDEKVVDNDLRILGEHGVNCIRVFPLWEDFQPIVEIGVPRTEYFSKKSFAFRSGNAAIEDCKFESGLSEERLEEFKALVSLAAKYKLKVIVAFLTGWMSGRYFIPEALRGKDLVTDASAVVFERLFVKDMVRELKGYDNIIAWESGNECNCLSYAADKSQSELWQNIIADAIRSEDKSRPVCSGMHTTRLTGAWSIPTSVTAADVMTVHPYPLFTPYCAKEGLTQMRASMHAAAETAYCSGIAEKPCIVEEIGTLGPMVISDDYADEYFETSCMTSFGAGSDCYLWWCAFDQDKFDFPPYDVNCLERNLGLVKSDGTPKPVLKKLSQLSKAVSEIGVLPPCEKDALVILTNCQDQWKCAYGAYMLASQAGYSVDIAYETNRLRTYSRYILPCIASTSGLPKARLDELVRNVKDGAELLITYGGGAIGDFEEITGLKVAGRAARRTEKTFSVSGKEEKIACDYELKLAADSAEILMRDKENNILLACNRLGKGKVYFLAAPLESAYTDMYMPESSEVYKIYSEFFDGAEKCMKINSDRVVKTEHKLENGNTGCLIVDFDGRKEFEVSTDGKYKVSRALYCSCDGKTLRMTRRYAYVEFEKK